VDERGYPCPFFVAWIDGKPDHRIVEPEKMRLCVREKRCWVCGEPLRERFTFVLGPMCVVNRVSSEPPSHHSCAEFSVKACPFLSRPRMHRREAGLPDEILEDPAGIMIKRNPGVMALWPTKSYQIRRQDGGMLFTVGDPDGKPIWFTEGRRATRQEVLDSMDAGLPSLRDMARAQGDFARRVLNRMHHAALRFIPSV